MVPRADIGAEGGQRPAGGAVDEDGRELDDLLWVDHRAFLAGRLKIDHHKEIKHLGVCGGGGGGGGGWAYQEQRGRGGSGRQDGDVESSANRR